MIRDNDSQNQDHETQVYQIVFGISSRGACCDSYHCLSKHIHHHCVWTFRPITFDILGTTYYHWDIYVQIYVGLLNEKKAYGGKRPVGAGTLF